jgi:hypothetical protein
MALPAEMLKPILQYAIADSIIEIRHVQDYEVQSAIRMIGFPIIENVNAGGLMPSSVSSLLRVNKALNERSSDLLVLPDTMFCSYPSAIIRIMVEMKQDQCC